VVDDGLLVFNNGSEGQYHSAVYEYAVDLEAREAERTWGYSSQPPLYCYAMEDVTRLETDDTLITWSTAGQIDQVTPEGEVVWSLNTSLGAGLGYTDWVDSLYIYAP